MEPTPEERLTSAMPSVVENSPSDYTQSIRNVAGIVSSGTPTGLSIPASRPTPSEGADYSEQISRLQQERSEGVASALSAVSSVNPDTTAEIASLSRRTGIPIESLMQDPAYAKSQAVLNTANQLQLNDNPMLAARMQTDSSLPSIVHDQLPEVSMWRTLCALPGVLGLDALDNNIAGWQDSYAQNTLLAHFHAGEWGHEAGKLRLRVANGTATDDDRNRLKWIETQMQSFPQTTGTGFIGGTAAFAGSMYEVAKALPEYVIAGASGGAIAGGGIALATGPAAPLAVLPAMGLGTLTGAGIGLEAGLISEFSLAAAGDTYAKTYEQTHNDSAAKWNAFGTAMANGVLFAVGGEAMSASAAALFGKTIAAKFATQGGAALTRPSLNAAALSGIKEFAKAELTVGGITAGQDIISQISEDVAAQYTPEDLRSELATQQGRDRIANRIYRTWAATVHGMQSFAIINSIAPVAAFTRDARAFQSFLKSRAVFEEVRKAATANEKLKQRAPGVVETLVADQVRGGPLETVYVDAAVMHEILKQSGLTAAQIEQSMPGMLQQLREAAILGGIPSEQISASWPITDSGRLVGREVSIPMGVYAENLFGTPLGDAIQKHKKLSAGIAEMTETEAEQFVADLNKRADEAEFAIAQDVERRRAFDEQAKAAEERIHAQLLAAGTHPDVAAVQAMMFRQMLVVSAADAGMTPAEYEAKHGQMNVALTGEPTVTGGERAQPSEQETARLAQREADAKARVLSMLAPPESPEPLEQAGQFDAKGNRVTDTPEFRAWFGSSVVTDEQGEPLVVYHGTSKDVDFKSFRVGMRGAWFTESPELAGSYAKANDSQDLKFEWDPESGRLVGREVNTASRIFPVYLRIEDPAQLTPEEQAQFKSVENYAALQRELFSKYKARGHDGIFIRSEDGKHDVWVVFDPKQIKSVFNRGTFSAESPNILFQEQSTRLPSGRKATEDPLLETLAIDWDLTLSHEATRDKNLAAFMRMPNFREPIGEAAKDPVARANAIVDHMANNLLYLFDKMPEEWRKRARLWYDGANKTVRAWETKYGISTMQGSAVIAVLSPQNPWFLNMSQAERVIDIILGVRDFEWSDAMTVEMENILKQDAANKRANERNRQRKWEEKAQQARAAGMPEPEPLKPYKPTSRDIATKEAIEKASSKNADGSGKTLNDLLDDPLAAAVWVRVFDQTHNTRKYRVLTPEGGVADWAKTESGNDAVFKWGSYQDIAKAISVLLDGRAENVFYQLGGEHKVRNFYNNIFNPTSSIPFATMDTHAGAAALLSPLSGEDKPIIQLFGGAGSSGSLETGQNGLYPFFLEAYKRAAESRGVSAREMQSITWEAVRALFESAQKNALKPEVESVWNEYRANPDMPLSDAHEKIFALANGLTPPDWVDVPFDDRVGRTYEGMSADKMDAALGKLPKAAERETRIMFEVAPDPRNAELTNRWNALSPEQRFEITKSVANVAVQDVCREFGVTADYAVQIGGWHGITNPNLILSLESSELALPIAKALGHVLNQQAMSVLSKSEARGLKPRGAITITLPDGYGFEEIASLYKNLWELSHNDQKLITGHLTAGGFMTILMPEDTDLTLRQFGQVVHKHLNEQFVVETFEAHYAEPTQQEYGYDVATPEERGRTAAQSSSTQRRIDRIRERSAGILENGINATADAGAGNAVFTDAATDVGRGGAGRASPRYRPLEGAPRVANATGPIPELVDVAEQYAKDNGIDLRRQSEYVKVDESLAKRIADAYEAMQHNPNDPVVREAYEELNRQTMAQYKALESAGYKFYFFDPANDPYADQPGGFGNPWNAMRDLRANKRMAVFPTESGFGSGVTDINVSDSPLLAKTGLEWPHGSPDGPMKAVTYNDLFRAVHDAMGHGLEGAGFRAQGEENAWQAHSRLFTGTAIGAMTSETRGQNSWLNYGPFGETNRTAKVEDTKFADQKIGLMPEWTWTEGKASDQVLEQAAAKRKEKGIRRGGYDPRTFMVMLTQKADWSTFKHEMWHHYFNQMENAVLGGSASDRLKGDFDILLQAWGIKGDTPEARTREWQSMSFEEKRRHYEAGAYNFEIYLSEGKSPSLLLDRAFEQFAKFLKQVYKVIRDELNTIYREKFGVDLPILTPEVRGVMDRMLATEDQIKQAEAARNMEPMFQTQEQSGMDDAQWAEYQRDAAEARRIAVAKLTKESIDAMQWASDARSKIIADRQSRHNQLRSEARREISERLASEPIRRVEEFLKTGKTKDEAGETIQTTGKFKLNLEDVENMFPDTPEGDKRRAEVRAKLRVGKYGMLAEDGLNPDLVAVQFDFSGGFELVDALMRLPNFSDQVRELTDAKMQREHSDLLDPTQIEQAVIRAIHNEARSRMIATELNHMANATKPVEPMVAAARRVAEEVIGKKQIRDVRPSDYANAEATARKEASTVAPQLQSAEQAARTAYTREYNKSIKAGLDEVAAAAKATTAAAEAKKTAETRAAEFKARYPTLTRGEMESSQSAKFVAIRAKQSELFQNQLTQVAVEAIERIDKGVRYLRDVLNAKNIKKMGADHADQVAQLLEKFDLKSRSLKSIDKREERRVELTEWLAEQKALGLVPQIPDELIALEKKNYKTMSVQEFSDLVEAVQQIEFMGKYRQRAIEESNRLKFNELRDELEESIIANAGARKVAARKPRPGWEAFKYGIGNFVGLHLRGPILAELFDGGQQGGKAWEFWIRSSNRCANRETTMTIDFNKRAAEILNPVRELGPMGGADIYFKGIDRSLNREERMAVALNMGNAGNIQRLMNGDGRGAWSMEQIQPILQSLTATEWEAVQKIWDLMDEFRPMIAEKERRLYGKEPDWVDPQPLRVTTVDGKDMELRGGYYPIVSDRYASGDANRQATAEAARQEMRAAFTSATMNDSFKKTRAKRSPYPLLLDMSAFWNGARDVIHDLCWHEWLINAGRMIRDSKIDRAIRFRYGPDTVEQFSNWIQACAVGTRSIENEGWLSAVSRSVAMKTIAFNIKSNMKHLFDFTRAAVYLTDPDSAINGWGWIGRGMATVFGDREAAHTMAFEQSEEMRNRFVTRFREIADLKNMVRDQSDFKTRLVVASHLLAHMIAKETDVAVWHAGRLKALANGADETLAADLGNQAVINSQMSSTMHNRAAIERGGPALKLLTTMYSFAGGDFNLAYLKSKTVASKAQRAAQLTMLAIPHVVLLELLKTALMPSDDQDKWKPSHVAARLADEELSFLFGSMIGVRELGGAAKMLTHGKGPGYSGPYGLSVIPDIYRLGQQTHQMQFDKAFIKSAISVLGDFTGTPSGAINNMIDGIQELMQHKTINPLAPILGVQRE